MFVRVSLRNGTKMWLRADKIFSVEKESENKVVTMVMLKPDMGYAIYESQDAVVEAICEAMKTGQPQIAKENAQEDSPPGRLIS